MKVTWQWKCDTGLISQIMGCFNLKMTQRYEDILILRIIDQEQSIQICPFKDNWKRSVSIIATFANMMIFTTHFIFIEYCSFSHDILTRTKWSLGPVLCCDNHRIIIRWVFSTERWYLSLPAQPAMVWNVCYHCKFLQKTT